jgi:hypothetical protein
LSEKFVAALKAELMKQEKAGIAPEKFSHKLNRALEFYIKEHKAATIKKSANSQ